MPVSAFKDVKKEDYLDLKRRLASEMMERYIQEVSHVDFRERISEIEISTPMTISHYVGAWKGSIYGYSHSMDDHVVARLQMVNEDKFIDGLEFAGAHSIDGVNGTSDHQWPGQPRNLCWKTWPELRRGGNEQEHKSKGIL